MEKIPLIEVKNLKKYYPIRQGWGKTTPLRAVDGVTLTLQAGDTLGLLGESGCGKSTLGRTLLCLTPPTSGEIYYQGQKVQPKRVGSAFRKNTAMVFQDPYASMNPRMSVADIIAEPLDIHRLYQTKAQRTQKILHLLSQVGLDASHAHRYPHEVSGGQRQRICIARALATEPSFLVCDEPVSALDVSIQAQILNMFKDLQADLGLSYLFISHDVGVVRHMSHAIAVMYLGRVVEYAPAEVLCGSPRHPYTIALMAAVPPRKTLVQDVPPQIQATPSPLDPPRGCPYHPRCPYAREVCVSRAPALRQVEAGHFVACYEGDATAVAVDDMPRRCRG